MADTNAGWSPDRGVQHFRESIEAMATSPEPLRDRVIDAYVHHLSSLLEFQVPPHDGSREKFADLGERVIKLRKDPSSDPDGQEASALAELILEIHKTIQENAPNREADMERAERDRLREELDALKKSRR